MTTLKNRSVAELLGASVFSLPKQDDRWVSSDVYIGLEIEAENVVLSSPGLRALTTAGWNNLHDGSLKSGGMEFVFHRPQAGDAITRLLDVFFSNPPPLTYDSSARAGVHIHINWSDGADFESIRRLIALMYCIEPAIFEWVDAGRKYCGYSAPLLELSDAQVRTMMTTESSTALISAMKGAGLGNSRYFGTNLQSLFKHGSVEFRYFPCTNERQKIEQWINLCMLIKKVCTESPINVQELVAMLSTEQGILDFLREHFAFDGIGDALSTRLDLVAAANRMVVLSYLMALVPAKFSRALVSPSRAATRYVQKNFPAVISALEASSDVVSALSEMDKRRGLEIRDLDELFREAFYSTNSTYQNISLTSNGDAV